MPVKINSKLDFMFGRRIESPHRTSGFVPDWPKDFCIEKNLTICSVCKNVVYQFSGKPLSPSIANTLRELGTDGLMRRAKLRPHKELLDAADLIYRYERAATPLRPQLADWLHGPGLGRYFHRHVMPPRGMLTRLDPRADAVMHVLRNSIMIGRAPDRRRGWLRICDPRGMEDGRIWNG
jgi:hypothetical protein